MCSGTCGRCYQCQDTCNCVPLNYEDAPLDKIDAEGVIYNMDTNCSTSNLMCFFGIRNGTNLKTILEKLDEKLCQVRGLFDEKVKVSIDDTSEGYLLDKLETHSCVTKQIVTDSLGKQKLYIGIDCNCIKNCINTLPITCLLPSFGNPLRICNGITNTIQVNTTNTGNNIVQFSANEGVTWVDGSPNNYSFIFPSNGTLQKIKARLKGCNEYVDGFVQLCTAVTPTAPVAPSPVPTTPISVPTTPVSVPVITVPVAPTPITTPVNTPTTTPSVTPVVTPIVAPVATPVNTPVTTPVTTPVGSIYYVVNKCGQESVTTRVRNNKTLTNGQSFKFAAGAGMDGTTQLEGVCWVYRGVTTTSVTSNTIDLVYADCNGCNSASPVASPTASPVASPTASPVASPTVSPTASPVASPVVTPVSTPVASCNYYSIQNTSSNTYNYTYPTLNGTLSGTLLGNNTVNICTSGNQTSIQQTNTSAPIITLQGVTLIGTSTCSCSASPTASPTVSPVATPVASPSVTPSVITPISCPSRQILITTFQNDLTASSDGRVYYKFQHCDNYIVTYTTTVAGQTTVCDQISYVIDAYIIVEGVPTPVNSSSMQINGNCP